MTLLLNNTTHSVTTNGKEQHFTKKEFDILAFLVEHPNIIFTPEEIYESVWKEKPYNCRQIISVHMCHIREKIQKNCTEQIVSSFWKKGYRFNKA